MNPEFVSLPDYGDLMTIEEFKENVNCGGFTDYDGHGNLSNGKQKARNFIVYPSQFKKGRVSVGNLWETQKIINIPKWATHIIWFNK